MLAAPRGATRSEILRSLGWRGERPLSLLDLVERGSLGIEAAAWLAALVRGGASFIVGAAPGGAGKTTTMRALLDFVPAGMPYALAVPGQSLQLGNTPHCVISHELSPHRVGGYLWGQDLRDFFALSQQGHVLAANLHADDLTATHGQICDANGVPEAHFRGVHLLLFLGRRGEGEEMQRYVDRIEYSAGSTAHGTAYWRGQGLTNAAPRQPQREASWRAFLEYGLAAAVRTVEDLQALLAERAGAL